MELSEHITVNRQLAESVCQRLSDEINKLGFAELKLKIIHVTMRPVLCSSKTLTREITI